MYKIIYDNKVIDVVEKPRFLKFLPSGHISLTGKSTAEGIIGSDSKTLYCFTPVPTEPTLLMVSIQPINTEEFNRLRSLLNSGSEICADDSLLAESRRTTIKRLSDICKNRIIAGFSITLSDGIKHEFKLTTEDQLNLLVIENQLNTGTQSFIYHSTNQPCKIFMREDMLKVVAAFKRHTLYHTTYFNAAKQYINALIDPEKINQFSYGDNVLDIVEDPILRQILKNGGNTE